MQRWLERILGLDTGFLGREGEFSLDFNPRWPFQEHVGAVTWNVVLAVIAALLVYYVYKREGRSRFARVTLGIMRAGLLAFVIAMLNRPVLTLTQSRTEPSVLAVVMDDSISMQVRDGGAGPDGGAMSRLQAVVELLNGEDQRLVRDLTAAHNLKFYRFNRDAQPLTTVTKASFAPKPEEGTAPSTQPAAAPLAEAFATLQPTGQSTQPLSSLRTVLEELQGQRLAGVVLISDGRDTPQESLADGLAAIKNFGAKIYPVAVGSEKPPQNITLESVTMQDAAFVKDIVNVRTQVRAVGYPAGHQVTLALRDKRTNQPLKNSEGKPVQETITITSEAPQEVELNFKPTEVGTLDVAIEAVKQAGEVDEEDNTRLAQV